LKQQIFYRFDNFFGTTVQHLSETYRMHLEVYITRIMKCAQSEMGIDSFCDECISSLCAIAHNAVRRGLA